MIFKRLLCNHNWESFRKKKYAWCGKTIVTNTEHWHQPIIEETEQEETVEILVCKKCGKLKTIRY